MPIYRDIYAGPPRWYGNTRTRKRYIAIHATSNDASAEAEASYAQRRPDSVSSHYYVDDDSIVQSLDTDLRAFHAGSKIGNDLAISYELTATASDMRAGRRWWLDTDNLEWPLFARQVALDCAHFGIEPRDLTVAEMTAGSLSGFVGHDEMGQAWGGTDHWDPGEHFPMDHLVRQVQRAMGDDMAWDDKLPVPAWFEREFPGNFAEGAASAAFFQTAGYGYGRLAYQQGRELAAGQKAILAAVSGQDVVAEVETLLAEHAQAERAERRADLEALAEPLTDAVVAAVAGTDRDLDRQTVADALRQVLREGVDGGT